MPQIRKLTPSEVRTLEYKSTGQRKAIVEQYDALLSDYAAGEYGEATLEPDEKRLTVRNRLRAAALRRGLELDFRRTNGGFLRFRVVDHRDRQSVLAAVPEAAATEVVAVAIPIDLPPRHTIPRVRPAG